VPADEVQVIMPASTADQRPLEMERASAATIAGVQRR
jgi:hypothetical protein